MLLIVRPIFAGMRGFMIRFDCSGKERSKIYQNVVLGLLVIVQLFFMMPTHFSAPEVNDHIIKWLSSGYEDVLAHVPREKNEGLLESVLCGQEQRQIVEK